MRVVVSMPMVVTATVPAAVVMAAGVFGRHFVQNYAIDVMYKIPNFKFLVRAEYPNTLRIEQREGALPHAAHYDDIHVVIQQELDRVALPVLVLGVGVGYFLN